MKKTNRIAVVGTISASMVSFRGSLLAQLKLCGYQVFAFAIDYNSDTEAKINTIGAEPVNYYLDRTGTNPVSDIRSTIQLFRLFQYYQIDTVFSYFIKPVVYASLAARLAGLRQCFALLPGLGYAFTDNKEIPTDFKKHTVGMAVKYLLQSSLRYNKRVFLYNPDDIEEIVQAGLVQPRKICRLNGTGVKLEDYPFVTAWNSPITFTLAARLILEKGIREFARAAMQVKGLYPKTRFLLLGSFDTNPTGLTEKEILHLVDEDILEWIGYVPDIRPWLEKTSVYVLPSYREGVPRSTQEALAMGRPVITTDAPGCRETVIDGVNGYLVPVGDSKALALAMIRFIENPYLIEIMGRESRKIAEEKFDVRKINTKILNEIQLSLQ
jgi:glycosyltransferase involved in cell wall biosynthesis